jgi:hypothetical protein
MDDDYEDALERLTNDELFSIVHAVVELAQVSAASDSDILRDIRDELAGYGLLKDEVDGDGQ